MLRRAEAVDARRRALLERIEALPAATLDARPEEGWSILEIVEHLVLAEEEVYGDLSGDPATRARSRSFRHRLAYLLVMGILLGPIPVPVPSDGMKPTGRATLAELRERWDGLHARLLAFVAGLDRRSRALAVFRHPIAGPMTPMQTVRMAGVHLARHERQIRRRLEAVGGGAR